MSKQAYIEALAAISYSLKYHIASKNIDVANKTLDLLMNSVREALKEGDDK